MPLMASSAMCSLTALSVFVLWRLHKALHPEIPFSPMPVAALVIFFASFFGAMAPALMLLNLILAHIPPLSRLLDKNGDRVPAASYKNSMGSLRKAAVVLVPVSLAVALLATIDPWSP